MLKCVAHGNGVVNGTSNIKNHRKEPGISRRIIRRDPWLYGWTVVLGIIILLVGYAIVFRGLGYALYCIVGLIVVSLPVCLSIRFCIRLPTGFSFLWGMGLLAHLVGNVMEVYSTIPQWDMVTHYYVFAILSYPFYCCFAVMDELLVSHRYSKLLLIILTVIATMASGVIWELLEFSQDQLMGTDSQPSLIDTMQDLIFDTLGGLTVAIILSVKTKKGRNPWIDHTVDDLKQFLMRNRLIEN